VVIALAVLATVVVLRACHEVGATRRAAGDLATALDPDLEGLAAAFRSGDITSTFVAAMPRLLPQGGTRLELAAFEATETFTRADSRRVLFDLIDMGTTVTEIRVPVTYRYHLRLDDEWHLEVRDRSCLVRAPAIRATLPPAIHTDEMEKRTDRGWLRFGADEQMDALERTITPSLELRAANPEHLGFVRETCRRRVAEFVRAWLLGEDHWREDRFSSVTVTFADEETGFEVAPPTLILEDLPPD
jgi:hypothetical protein